MNTFNVKIGSARILSSLLFCAVIAITLVRPIATVRAAGTADGGGVPSDYTLLEPLPDIGASNGGPIPVKYSVSFSDYVTYLYNLFIALAAVAAVFMIVWGGFEYVTTDSWQGKDEGKKKLYNAVGGLLLVLCSWLILHTIDPTLTNINPTLVPKLQLKGDIASSGGSTRNLLDQLQQQADSYQISNAQTTQDLATARTAVNTLQSRIDQLTDDRNFAAQTLGEDDPAVQDYDAEIQKLNDQVTSTQALVVLNAGKTAFTSAVGSVSTIRIVDGQPTTDYLTEDPNYYPNLQKAQALVDKAYIQQSQNLANLQGTEQQQQDLRDSYDAAKAQLMLQDSVYKNAPLAHIPIIAEKVQNDLINDISDQNLKAQVQANYDAVLKQMCAVGLNQDPHCPDYNPQ